LTGKEIELDIETDYKVCGIFDTAPSCLLGDMNAVDVTGNEDTPDEPENNHG
jgi:hypothetical protein